MSLVNIFKPVSILEPWVRRRPGLYAEIPVPVIQDPRGEEGGPRGFSKLLKEDEKEKDEEQKKEDDYDE